MGNVDDSLWTSVPTMNSPPKTRRWNSALNDFRSSLKRPWRLDTTNDNPISGDEKRLLPSSERLSPPELPPSFSSSDLDKTPDIFTFRNLQDIQHIEEKAQEAMLVLKLNTDVLEQLRLQYEELTKHEEFPQETFMSTDILKFQNGEQELQIQGLKLYLKVALPATAMTFIAWYVIYCLARRETRQNDRSEAAGEA
ncbi:hypothetical protein J4E82_002129 [Alternaria postmessia]|uniref:uncharacterized protein n=1 Tax=Alternaria postmessia TaxID=1187938 RepID=UPI002224C9CD|nr:uncharacterized protein J4E82_002129 [Alternaria postmessia]KAI5379142.1 hypothetical protein J4E82_002129 [Alternaria postmessia]